MNPAAIQAVKSHIAKLRSDFPELADDPALLADTIEGETDFAKIAGFLAGEVKMRNAEASGLKEFAAHVTARAQEKLNSVDRIRAALESLMECAGSDKIKTAHGSVYFTTRPASVVITDEAALPVGMRITKTTPDKAAIYRALEDGVPVPGAALTNGGRSLTIR